MLAPCARERWGVRHIRATRTTLLFAAAPLAVSPPALRADELWRQDPLETPGGYSSQEARNAGGPGWFSEAADNFTGGYGWTISSVEFWGGYSSGVPQGSIFRGAMVRFYSDVNGRPGVRLYEHEVAFANETLYQQALGVPQFHYWCVLSPAFSLPAPGRYWISIVGIVDFGGVSTNPQWGWAPSSGDAPPACEQWFFPDITFGPQSGDLSFVLQGTSGHACYANCDGSTAVPVLNVQDFTCFLQRFAAGDPGANCDGSTSAPVLNVHDFTCFLQQVGAGCP
jgi:hypothetical protein